jgi:hypothetical protein
LILPVLELNVLVAKKQRDRNFVTATTHVPFQIGLLQCSKHFRTAYDLLGCGLVLRKSHRAEKRRRSP